jgi:hypothetical protein
MSVLKSMMDAIETSKYLLEKYQSIHHMVCAKNFNIENVEKLKGGSVGVGGALLLTGVIKLKKRPREEDLLPVVLKIFPIDCQYKYIRNRQRPQLAVRDYGDFELGTGIVLTQLALIYDVYNITYCYNKEVCDDVYPTENNISKCSNKNIDRSKNIFPESCTNMKNPLCSYKNIYDNVVVTEAEIKPQLSDSIRILVAEKCMGDLDFLLLNNVIEQDVFIYILLMIFHTLLKLDEILGEFHHGDLGPRNVLYVVDDVDGMFTYDFPGFDVDIPKNIPFPKLWDFEKSRFSNVERYSNYYNYLGDERLPVLPPTFIINDVYTLLSKIKEGTRYADSINIESIKNISNNTEAINIILEQIV